MLNNSQLFQLGSLYISAIGITLSFITFAICGLLNAISWSHSTGRRLSGILTFIAILSIGLALIGMGAWVYAFENTATTLPSLPDWSVAIIKELLPN